MISELYAGLINNTCLLLTTGIIYFTLSLKDTKSAITKNIFSGVILGVIGVFIMSSPIELVSGVIFDTRSILISVVGMFFGFIPTIIAAIVMCAYRIFIGGSGTIMGVAVILSTAGFGLLWNKFRLNYIVQKNSNVWLEFYIFGLLTHILMLVCTFALPQDIIFNVLKNISIPVIIIYPIGSFLLCMIIFKQMLISKLNLKLKENEEKFRLLTENISDVISVLNLTKRKTTYVSPSIYNLRGITVEEAMNESFEDALTPESLVVIKEAISKNKNKFISNPNEPYFSITEVQERCKNGDIIWVELSSKYLYNADGEIEVLVVSRNIEKRKNMEQELEYAKILLQASFDQSPVVMAIVTYPDCKFKIINKAAEEFLLMNKVDFINKNFDEINITWKYFMPDGRMLKQNELPLKLTLDGITTKNMELITERHDGTRRWQLCSATPIYDNNGKIIAGMIVMPDITELKQAEGKIKESEYMLLESQKVAHIGSYVNDVVNNTWTSSSELGVIFGIDEKYNHTLEGWVNIVHPDWREKLLSYVSEVYSQQSFFDMQYKIVRVNDGAERWVHGLGNLEFDENGNTIKMIGTIQDITERKIKDEAIIYSSSHDILTGLYNRRKFEEVLDSFENSCQVLVSIIVGDVNGLKLINDAYGHSAGDIILKKISEIIIEVCGDDICSARRGGDEFAIILPGVTYEEAGLKVIQIKKRCMEESEDELMLTITFGVGTKTEKEQSLEQIQHLAEERMYTNKLLEGKNIRSSIVENLRLVLEEKTGETRNHCNRMSEMSQILGEKIGFQEFEISNLKLLSLLHDIGKTAIPESILLKPGSLNEEEFSIMKKHCEIGYRIANTMPELVPIAEGILCHHERWDGTGYPQGLAGNNIPMMSRIVAVLDTYDAMTNDRPYRKALSEKEAIEEIKLCSGTQFDPEVVNIFLNNVLKY